MVPRSRLLVAASLVIWGTALVSALVAQPPATVGGERLGNAQKTTTSDGVYTKAQADGAKAQFDKICADCHPFTVAAKKKTRDVPLGDEPFFESWEGRSLGELITTVALTMPNDGSAVVSDEEAANLVAYVLQQNGFAPGEKPLTKDGGGAVVARPKKK